MNLLKQLATIALFAVVATFAASAQTTPLKPNAAATQAAPAEKTDKTEKADKGKTYITVGLPILGSLGEGAGTDYNKMFRPISGTYNLQASQYASLGISLSLEAITTFPNSIFGVGGIVQLNGYALNTDQIAKDFHAGYTPYNYTASGNDYTSFNTLVGGAVELPINQKKTIFFEGRGFVGLASIGSQKVTIVATDISSGSSASIAYNYGSAAGFAAQIDAGLRFDLGHFTLRLNSVYNTVSTANRDVNYSNGSSSAQGTLKSTAIGGLGVGLHLGANF